MWKYRNTSTIELHHHGVKGQQWGVRNGPPYPIEDKILRKGTRLNSVSTYNDSTKYKNRKAWMYTYSPKDKWDSKVYKGPFSVYKAESTNKFIYEHLYEVVKDLKMPTSKERFDEFIKVFQNDKTTTISDLEKLQKNLKRRKIGTKKVQNLNLQNLRTKEDYKNAYELFNHAMENVNQFKSTKEYAKIMSTKWDAMVDDNNQGLYNRVHDPIIVFRADTALKEIGKARYIDYNEIAKNYTEVEKKLNKLGERVAL